MEYAPDIEEYSIDESFLFFNKCNFSLNDWYEIGRELKKRIFTEVGMPISVGAAPTKTLAKLYNKKAKDHGGVLIFEASKLDKILEDTDCATIWGIGPARARTLQLLGIKNALQLKNMDLNLARKLMTSQGVDTVRELNGIRCIDRVEHSKKDVITFELKAAPIGASDHLDSYSRSKDDLLKEGELITSSICFCAVNPHDSGIR